MVIFLARHPMVFIFLNLFDLLECPVDLMTLTLVKKVLTAYFRNAFSKFYRRHFDIVSKYHVGLKTLLLQGLSEPEFLWLLGV